MRRCRRVRIAQAFSRGWGARQAARGQLREILRSETMDGKAGSTRMLYRVRASRHSRILLVGLGKEEGFGEKQYRDCARAALLASIVSKGR